MRALRIAAVAVTAAVLVAGLTACGSDGKAGTKAAGDAAPGKALELDPKAALAASALVMQKAGNATFTVAAPDGLEARPGAGTANWSGARTAVEYVADGQGQKLKVRMVGGDVYYGVGAAAGAPGELWVKATDVVWRAKAGPFVMLLGQTANPVVQLAAAQSGQISKGGAETVDGVQLTRYRSVEEVATVLAAVPDLTPERRAALQQAVEKNGKTLTVDFWLNAKQELVQYREFGEKDGEQKAVTVKYTGLGSAPKVEAPAENQLGKASDLAKLLN
ncbi:hypothetical protein [Kitasatospora sp. NPDC047058]|uniref:hypothetical protein n=1 Tax=Kitasatospora sp. NPDC047058 TaxID=3155620 RepID=UPI0033DA0E1A